MPAGIGETLREARHDARIELDEIERTIRIRGRYLAALENEDWGVLPGEAYVRGFLRTYGDYLGLDGAALVDEYNRLRPSAEPDHVAEASLERPLPESGDRFVRRAVPVMAGLVAALAILFIVLAVTGGSDKKAGGHGHQNDGKGGGSHANSTTTTIPTPAEASVTLQPTGTVWVCLVDHAGSPLVNGETLTVGDDRGPFKDREMQLTLGNGEIQISLDGEQVSIPSAGEPVGFDLTPQGATPLSSSARPTCS